MDLQGDFIATDQETGKEAEDQTKNEKSVFSRVLLLGTQEDFLY